MRALIPAALLALALTACGDDGQSGPQATDDVTETQTPPVEPSASSSEPITEPAPSEDASSSPSSPSSSSSSSSSGGGECEGLTDPASGRPLCDFQDEASYPYRLAVAQDPDGLLTALQQVAPWLGEGDLDAVISTCEQVAQGGADPSDAVARFSGGTDEQVTVDQARELIDISERFACP